MEILPRYLEVSGDAFTRGRTHGGELRQQVNDCVDFYRSLFGLGESELARRADIFARLIDAYSPALGEEIRGIASGAQLPVAHLFALNARSELVPFDASECTAVSFPREALLGQTWDWCEQLQELVTILRITGEDGHRVLTVTEPGIVGKIGLSDAGLGVCLNFLIAARSADGVPIHILLREALAASSLDSACLRLRAAGPGRAGNILLGSSGQRAVNFEYSGDEVAERQLTEHFSHTNHCLERELPAGDMEENSKTRLSRAERLLTTPGLTGLAGMKAILSNQEDAGAPICAPFQTLQGLNVGTLCTAIMDLSRRELHLRMGSDPGAGFQIFALDQGS
jgi:isopenicillin-N N-acyltransferase-like protein